MFTPEIDSRSVGEVLHDELRRVEAAVGLFPLQADAGHAVGEVAVECRGHADHDGRGAKLGDGKRRRRRRPRLPTCPSTPDAAAMEPGSCASCRVHLDPACRVRQGGHGELRPRRLAGCVRRLSQRLHGIRLRPGVCPRGPGRLEDAAVAHQELSRVLAGRGCTKSGFAVSAVGVAFRESLPSEFSRATTSEPERLIRVMRSSTVSVGL